MSEAAIASVRDSLLLLLLLHLLLESFASTAN